MPAVSVDAFPASTIIFRKTKLCKFNMAGRCMRGGACTFAHSTAELEPPPNFHCTKMCPALCETGRCDRGAACTFAHKESELRVPTKGTAPDTTAHAAPAAAWTPPAAPTPAAAPTPMAPRPPVAPRPPTPLISTQSVLAGMGVVLLQVFPAYTAFGEQGDVNRHRDEDTYSDISDVDDLDTCDSGLNGWSRQTTEEGIEEPSGEFSRQSSEKSAWGLEEVPTEQGEVEEAADREEVRLGGAFDADGLTYVVKNTFLQFEDRDEPLPILRRVSSMGDCAVGGEAIKEPVRGVPEEQSNVLRCYTASNEQRDVDEQSEISDVDLDFSTCDNGASGWSRQSTEEGFEAPSGEFSRQSSEESAWSPEDVSSEQSKVEDQARLGNSFGGDGLTYVVMNSFLQFEDRDGPLPILRRVSSTGSCALRGL